MAQTLTGYTVFLTYLLVADTVDNLIVEEIYESQLFGYTPNLPTPPIIPLGEGNSKYIHCNYINKLVLSTNQPLIEEIIINFPYVDDFKFLSNSIYNGTGYTANKIYALIQLVDNSNFTNLSDVKSDPREWRKYNLTNQILTFVVGDNLTPELLTSQVFKIPLNNYFAYRNYYLSDDIIYPTKQPTADGELCFGEEQFFFGNIRSDIKAIAYTTDIAINLSLNEFNSTTNKTWNGAERVHITEIGIYDDEKNLVAIGKLNNPIPKDSTIARTIVFDIDF